MQLYVVRHHDDSRTFTSKALAESAVEAGFGVGVQVIDAADDPATSVISHSLPELTIVWEAYTLGIDQFVHVMEHHFWDLNPLYVPYLYLDELIYEFSYEFMEYKWACKSYDRNRAVLIANKNFPC